MQLHCKISKWNAHMNHKSRPTIQCALPDESKWIKLSPAVQKAPKQSGWQLIHVNWLRSSVPVPSAGVCCYAPSLCSPLPPSCVPTLLLTLKKDHIASLLSVGGTRERRGARQGSAMVNMRSPIQQKRSLLPLYTKEQQWSKLMFVHACFYLRLEIPAWIGSH